MAGVDIATASTHHHHHHAGGVPSSSSYQDWYHPVLTYVNPSTYGSDDVTNPNNPAIPYNTPTIIGFDIQQPLPPLSIHQSSQPHNSNNNPNSPSGNNDSGDGSYMINVASDYQVQYEVAYAQIPYHDQSQQQHSSPTLGGHNNHRPIHAQSAHHQIQQQYSSPDQAYHYGAGQQPTTPGSPNEFSAQYQQALFNPFQDHTSVLHSSSPLIPSAGISTTSTVTTASIQSSGASPSYEAGSDSSEDLDTKEPNKKRLRETIDISGASILTKDQVLQLSSKEIEEYVYRLKQTHILTPSQEKDLKKFRRLIKNREYASQSRDRKKLYVNQVVDQLEKSELDNRTLKDQLAASQSEVRELKKQLEMVNQTIQSNPSLIQTFSKFFTFGSSTTATSASSSTGADAKDTNATTTTTAKKASSLALFVFFCIFTFTFLLPNQPSISTTHITSTKGKSFVGPRSLLHSPEDTISIAVPQKMNWISNLFPSSSSPPSSYPTELVDKITNQENDQQVEELEELEEVFDDLDLHDQEIYISNSPPIA